MMRQQKLDESNALIYAAQNYINVNCVDTVEFYDDLKRFQYIKRLLNKYKETGEFKDRLILNHIIILYNVFEHTACTRLLFLKLPEHHNCLKTILTYMGYMPKIVYDIGISATNYYNDQIVGDVKIEQELQKI